MTRSRRITPKIKSLDELKIVHPHAAGLDIGAREIWVSVPASSTADHVRVFGTFTVDLQALADWLSACVNLNCCALPLTVSSSGLMARFSMRRRSVDQYGRTLTTGKNCASCAPLQPIVRQLAFVPCLDE